MCVNWDLATQPGVKQAQQIQNRSQDHIYYGITKYLYWSVLPQQVSDPESELNFIQIKIFVLLESQMRDRMKMARECMEKLYTLLNLENLW
jgi:hypothetical protein